MRLLIVRHGYKFAPMKTNQPVWQLIANLGDANPLSHGGFFVYVDRTGVYDPECAQLTPIDDDQGNDSGKWELRRFSLPRCTFSNGILSDNRFHPESAAWFASNDTARPQDTTSLAKLASYSGLSEAQLIALFTSENVGDRAQAWLMVGNFHGFDNLDSYPQILSRKDVFNRFRKECFPRAVKRTSRASVVNSFGKTLRVGDRVSFSRVNDSQRYEGTIKAIDRASDFAKAYGAQISFADSPFTVTANDCAPI